MRRAPRVRRARIPPHPQRVSAPLRSCRPTAVPRSRACRHAPLPPCSITLANHARTTEPRLLRPSAAVRGGEPVASRRSRPPDATRSLPALPFSCGRRLEATLEPDPRSWREPRSPAQQRCVARSASWTASHSRRLQEEPGAFCTVWLRRKDAPGAPFLAFKDVEVQSEMVDSFRTCVAAKLGLDPSLLNLYLVPCGSRKPTAEEEKAAVLLDDPRLSLVAAGVTDGCSLLAYVAKPDSVAAVPTRVHAVTSRARGRQQLSEWPVLSQGDLDRHLAHGLLWLSDSGGALVRPVVTLSELSQDPSAKYYLQLRSEPWTEDSDTAPINILPPGAVRESTRGIANDQLVRQAFGTVTPLLGGGPALLDEDGQMELEVDGLLGTEDCAWVLLNSAKLTAGKVDVYEALKSSLKLHDLLRSETCGGQASALAPYSHARVHAFLSATHFLPGVKELALQKGVTPVECSGARFHVP
jgi:hypothetical protein